MSLGKNKVILIGYSGHAFVVADIFQRAKFELVGYCDAIEKEHNPFKLPYFGNHKTEDAQEIIKNHRFFIAIGNNLIRREIFDNLSSFLSVNATDPSSIISQYASLGTAVMVGAGVKINAFARIGNGVICNTGAIVEHECKIADFVHLAPGSVLCGNVTVGENSFVGANTVVKQGITIGNNVTIGAGSVILRNIPDNCTVFGNPGKIIYHV
ncbi:MAG: acetyltransferase [Saprospiraceae bacterium]